MGKLTEKNLIAVYGTLKRAEGNHGAMVRAQGEFVKETYVEFKSICGSGFPTAKFESGTNKFVKVEIFNVPEEGVLNSLDRLEGYPTFYDRKEVVTTDGDTVIIYEIVREITDDSERFLTEETDGKKYYTWK